MRVTERMMSDNMVQYLNDNRERLARLQEQIGSNKQFLRPSDNPAAAAASLTLHSSIEINNGFLDSAHTTSDWMAATDGSIQQMGDIGLRSKNLVLDGASDSNGPDQRKVIGTELDGILRQAIDIANTSHNDNYIFAGFKTTTKPFQGVDTNNDGLYDVVDYQGDSGTIIRTLAPGQNIPVNVNGNASFSDFFNALIAARDAMNSNNTAAIQSTIGTLKTALDKVTEAGVMNGARQNEVSQLIDRTNSTQLELKSLLSQKEDINLAEAITNLSQQENVYQSVLQVSKRALSVLSLFDVLG